MPCNAAALRDLLADRLGPVAVADVETHLERCPHCRMALDRLAGGESWASAVRDELLATRGPEALTDPDGEGDDPLDFLAPSEFPDSLGRVGPYEVKGVLGRGGNGIVLKAFDAGLNRFVAVKVIAAVLSGSGAARQRFTREARAAAAVVHENVVAVHAVDQAGGLPYLVMEYVKGRSAQDKLDRTGPLPVLEVLRIAHQTAAGLAAAHAQGLVHRDIKPANILLENGVERVKLTDFGLARAVTDACLTQSGVIAGTPYYMAPEQARGDAIDHRADLFSLGSTLYALLAGRPPFRADTPLAVLRRVVDDTPRPLREINPDVPDWLARVIARLMAKDPADRYQTADEAAGVFGKCLAHLQNPLATPPPRVPGLRRPPPRRRTAALTAVAGLAVLAGTYQAGRPPAGGQPGAGGRPVARQDAQAEQTLAAEVTDNVRQTADAVGHTMAHVKQAAASHRENPEWQEFATLQARMIEVAAELKATGRADAAGNDSDGIEQELNDLCVQIQEARSPKAEDFSIEEALNELCEQIQEARAELAAPARRAADPVAALIRSLDDRLKGLKRELDEPTPKPAPNPKRSRTK